MHTASNPKTEGGISLGMKLMLVHAVLGVASLEYSCVGLFGDQADVHVHVRKISASTRSCGDHSRDMLC